MSIELPSASSGSKRIGFAEEDMRTVETVSVGAALVTAARRGAGIAFNVAAALAAPRNSRRDIDEIFMDGGSIAESDGTRAGF
jgi:hypothetical protein